MSALNKIVLTTAMLISLSSPSHAFLTELVVGMTSVTNNLIDSTESVTNNTVNAASTTMLSLSSNPGKMADRIGLMADRIGFMADRIVTTEGIMAGLAHKIIDSNSQPRVVHQYASAYATEPAAMPLGHRAGGYGNSLAYPYTANNSQAAATQKVSGNPYLTAQPTPIQVPLAQSYVPKYDHPRPSDNTSYSASQMIYGVSGVTYTAARPAAQSYNPSGYGFAAQPTHSSSGRMCSSYGMTRSC